ncbi:MAG TPA: hypothetical protein IAC63_00030 [Candidatus Enterousia avicola]|uniref:KAP NTPase domain-containing protein n=1 Tax=Candidatus Enterousia avicola TaxID=2840787 RepID=A0A9D1SMH6_9PROT|nr:hypothetical protein [Candidatus Enterousia avicola]
MKDIANIFKLPPDELERKKANLWNDTAPEIVQFAKDLQEFIKKVDTPYVLGLDGGYGTGKTHFATRFCAQMHEEIMSLYFSAWEKDYYNNPMLSFVEMITWLVKNEQETIQAMNMPYAKQALISLWQSVDLSIPFTPPACPISGKLNIKKLLRKTDDPILPTDILQKAKYDLAEFIKRLPNHKLVLIVDDMDRCRPDIAVKTLEVIKHFFDIEGLIVIIPVGKERLTKYINAFYGLPTDSREDKEEYLQKFLNETIQIPELNYLKICQDKITAKDFTQNLVSEGDYYNSITVLQKWMAHYAKLVKLSYRETSEIINQAKIFCNNYKEPIRCRLLAYTLCNKIYHEKVLRWRAAPELAFGDNDIYQRQKNPRLEAFARHPARNAFALIHSKYNGLLLGDIIKNLYTTADRTTNTYSELYDLIKTIKEEVSKINVKSFIGVSTILEPIQAIWDTIIPGLEKLEKELHDLQNFEGSDDDDLERAKDYNEKLKNPQHI